VGPATFRRLTAEHGSARAALAALPAIARAAGVADYAPCAEAEARAELATGRAAGAFVLRADDPRYPARLRDLPDAPPVLWCLGEPALLARPMVALVGARNASSIGLRMARRLAEGLGAAGAVVVSGLARGIDAAAHAAALGSGTIAVMAGGIDTVYPPENAELAAAIAAQGLRISERPPGAEARARDFPARNRIVAGLALGVVVVEAAVRSGSLLTALDALDLGRELMAVPGHPVDPRAGGCNQLIRTGATLVRDAADVLEALQEALPGAAGPPLRGAGPGGTAAGGAAAGGLTPRPMRCAIYRSIPGPMPCFMPRPMLGPAQPIGRRGSRGREATRTPGVRWPQRFSIGWAWPRSPRINSSAISRAPRARSRPRRSRSSLRARSGAARAACSRAPEAGRGRPCRAPRPA